MIDNQHQKQGERLKIIRKHLGLNQFELAQMLNITQPHLSSLEKGKYSMTIDLLWILKKIMPELSLSWLVTGDYDMCETNISMAAEPSSVYEKEQKIDRIEAFLKEHFPAYK